MRLGLLIKDSEYRDALADKLASYDKDIFVNILDGSDKDTAYSLVLTDILPEELDPSVLDAIKARTVFLLGSDRACSEGLNSVFKYSGVPSLISELSAVYNEWQGLGPGRPHTSKLISVCCDSDSFSSVKCLQLARQIIYLKGGRVLIIPLSYVNDYGASEYAGKNILSRLMYSMHTGRRADMEAFTFSDSYGVSYVSLPPGINPLAYLDAEELSAVLSGLGAYFGTVICDAATCFRDENIKVLKESDRVVCFEHGRRELGLSEVLGDKADKLVRIKISEDPQEASAIDEVIRSIYSADQKQ